jgi:hypothetical protein
MTKQGTFVSENELLENAFFWNLRYLHVEFIQKMLISAEKNDFQFQFIAAHHRPVVVLLYECVYFLYVMSLTNIIFAIILRNENFTVRYENKKSLIFIASEEEL